MATVDWSSFIPNIVPPNATIQAQSAYVVVGGQTINATITNISVSSTSSSITFKFTLQFSSPGGTLTSIAITVLIQNGSNIFGEGSFVSDENQQLPAGTVTITKTYVVVFNTYAPEQ